MVSPAETVALDAPRDGSRIRRWRSGDADPLCRAVAEALPGLRPWMSWATDAYDRAAAADFLRACRRCWASGDAYGYAIVTDDTIVGACGLENRIGGGGLEIGYWLHPAYTGRGLATRAAAALVDQAFALAGIDHVQIWHDAANTASAGIPRRLGFTEIARRTPPRHPLTPGELGVDVIWQLRNVP